MVGNQIRVFVPMGLRLRGERRLSVSKQARPQGRCGTGASQAAGCRASAAVSTVEATGQAEPGSCLLPSLLWEG